MLKEAVVPEASAAWFCAGETAALARPGDLVLVHKNKSFLSQCIRFGESLRGHGEWAWTNHSAIVVEYATGEHSAIVVEETARGAVLTPLSDWHDVIYAVIRPRTLLHERQEAVDFALWALGTPYSWVGIVGQVIDCITGLHLSVGTQGRMICSGLACRAHERLGLIPDCEPSMCMPSDLARWYGVSLDPGRALYGSITGITG